MKKKIGIITLPLNTNSGGLIQAYALRTVIEKLGFSACVSIYKIRIAFR